MTRIPIPEGSLFGTANLPYGVFSTGGGDPRVGVRVGDHVLDLSVALGDEVFAQPTLNAFMAQGYQRWVEVRAAITTLVGGEVAAEAVVPVESVQLHLPFAVADYVDYYASEYHATNLGRLFRPGTEPLTPNWKHLPIGYHGRSGTIIVSGVDYHRPCGQRKGPQDPVPVFGPSIRLDIEAEIGFVVGDGSPLGGKITTAEFDQHVFGVMIFNDWSARDLQAWEYVPLGPYLGKSFASSLSPWVVPMLALQEAKCDTPTQDPTPLPYLKMDRPWGLDIDLTVIWNGQEVSYPPYGAMYWSPAQMLAHMTVNGASSRTGDFFASGTISGPEKNQRGAFIELTWGGQEPITVNGEERTFLLDGDEIVITATAPGANGQRIGFGEVRTKILPAKE